MNNETRPRHLVAALAAASLLLAGCGGGNGDGDDNPNGSGSSGGESYANFEDVETTFGSVRCFSSGSTTGASYFFAAGVGRTDWQLTVTYDEVGGPAEEAEDREFDFSAPHQVTLEYGGGFDDVEIAHYRLSPDDDLVGEVNAVEGDHVTGQMMIEPGGGGAEIELEFELYC